MPGEAVPSFASSIRWTPVAPSNDLVRRVTEQKELLGHRPVLRRAIDLRNPYVDALSFLQLRFLPEARSGDEQAGRVVAVTVVAAGLQNTG